jgi:Pectate lyase superfamily protein
MFKLTKLLFLFALLLFVPTFVSAIEVNPEDYGAIIDDGMDDSAAIQDAIDAVVERGGGRILFPSGTLNINRPISIQPRYNGGQMVFKGNRGSVLEISVGDQSTAIYAGNLNIMTFEDLAIVGKNVPMGALDFFDAKYVIYTTYVGQTNITRCQMLGLAVKNGDAIIYLGNTDARVTDSQFDGNLAMYDTGAVILAQDTMGLTVSRSTFMDYANFKGTYHSKTPGFVGAWIMVKGGKPMNALGQRRIVIEDSRFDEGAATVIWAENVAWVHITGIVANINGTIVGRGIFLRNVEYANIRESWFGYTGARRPALDFENVGGAEVTSLKFGGGVYFFKQFGTMKVNINYCPQCVAAPPLRDSLEKR